MNPALHFVFERRSVRTYQHRDVPAEAVRDLLEAAMAAPSACCTDPWEFIVVRNAASRQRIADALPNGAFLAQAPVGIVVCGNLQRAHAGELSYMIQDCAAAIENLLLAARALDLGACWLGVHPRQDRVSRIKAIFSLPEHIVPLAALAIGWSEQKPEARTRYIESKVHHEAWV